MLSYDPINIARDYP